MSETVDHDFTKISWQDYATCSGCGAKIQFVNNPNAHKDMMDHECPSSENEGSTPSNDA